MDIFLEFLGNLEKEIGDSDDHKHQGGLLLGGGSGRKNLGSLSCLLLGNLLLVLATAFPLVDTVDAEVHRKLVSFLDGRDFKEVVGKQGFFRTPTSVRVHRQEPGDQLDRVVSHPLGIWKIRLQSRFQAIGETRLVISWLELAPQLALLLHVGPFFFRRMPARAKDEI